MPGSAARRERDGAWALSHLLHGVFETTPPVFSHAEGAEEHAPPTIEFGVPPTTLRSMLMSLKPDKDFGVTIDAAQPFDNIEQLITAFAAADADDDAAGASFNTPTALVKAVRKAFTTAGAFEMLERFNAAVAKAATESVEYSSNALIWVTATAMHDVEDLESMKEDDYTVDFKFKNVSSASKEAITGLFDGARVALLRSGTFVVAEALKSNYKKCRTSMIMACGDVHLKQEVAASMPKSLAISENSGIIEGFNVFRVARRAVIRHFSDLFIFTPAAGAPTAATAPAAAARAAPVKTASTDMTLDGGAPHVRRRAESAKKNGIDKFAVLHMDCQTAARANEIIKPICADNSKLDWTRQNCKGAMGAAVFIFTNDDTLVTQAASGFAKFQDENIDTENFGTPFLDTVSKSQSIYITSPSASTTETASSRCRVELALGDGRQRVRFSRPRPAWADDLVAGAGAKVCVSVAVQTEAQAGGKSCHEVSEASRAHAEAGTQNANGDPSRVISLLEQRAADKAHQRTRAKAERRKRKKAKEEGAREAAAVTSSTALASAAAASAAAAAAVAAAQAAAVACRAVQTAHEERRGRRRKAKKDRSARRGAAVAAAKAAQSAAITLTVTWPSGRASQVSWAGAAPIEGDTIVVGPRSVPAEDLAAMRSARGSVAHADGRAGIIGAMGATVGANTRVTAVVATISATGSTSDGSVRAAGGMESLPCAGAAPVVSSMARDRLPPLPIATGPMPVLRAEPAPASPDAASAGLGLGLAACKGWDAACDEGMSQFGLGALVAAAAWAEAIGVDAIEDAQASAEERARHRKAKRRTYNSAAARELPRGKDGVAADMGEVAAAAVAAACCEDDTAMKQAMGGKRWREGERVQARTERHAAWTNATVQGQVDDRVMVTFTESVEAVALGPEQIRPRSQKARKEQAVREARAAKAASASVAFDDGTIVAHAALILPPLVSTRVQVRVRCAATAARWGGHDLQIDSARISDELCTGSSISGAGKHIYIHVANTSGRAVALAKGTKLGAAYPVQVIDCADAAPAVAVGAMGRETAAPNEFSAEDEPMLERLEQVNINPNAPQGRTEQLRALVRRFPNLVSNKLRRANMPPVSIPTKPGCTPAYTRPYRLSKYEKGVLDGEVDRMIRIGALEDSSSTWCSPMLLVSKKPLADGSSAGFRCVSDFRELNARLSHVEQFPLPDCREMMESLEGSAVFSSADCLHGFWSVGIRAEDRHKLAFQVGDRNLQYKVLPMGVASSSAIFQKFTTATFARCPHTRIFVDDLLVASPSWEQHMNDLEQAFEAADAAGLTFKPKKLFLGYTKLRYLGYDISTEGVKLGDDTISALSNKPPPTSTKEAQRLLGLANWARPFLVGFSDWMGPIMQVARPSHRWTTTSWGEAQEAAFDELKRQLARRTQLSHPLKEGRLRLFTDASCEALGAVLTQLQGGRWVPLGFHSRRCSEAESHYSPSCLEAAAVLEGLRRWRSILHGPARGPDEPRVEIVTDHSALQQVTMNMEKSPQLARWKAALQEFSYSITHRAGIKMAFVDYFSRGPHSEQDCWRDSDFYDTLNHATDYLQSEKRFIVAAARRAGAPVQDSARARVAWADGSSSEVTVLIDSGAQIDLAASGDVPLAAYVPAGDGDIRAVEGVGEGRSTVQGRASASVCFSEDAESQTFQADVHVLRSETCIDSRAHLILSAEFLDRHGISRIGGSQPYIACGSRRLSYLSSTSVEGARVAAATRSRAPEGGEAPTSAGELKIGDVVEVEPLSAPGVNSQGGVARVTGLVDGGVSVRYILDGTSEKGVSNRRLRGRTFDTDAATGEAAAPRLAEALPSIVEFKEAQRADPTWLAAEAWADSKDSAAELLKPLPKKVVTWIKQRKFSHDENGLLVTAAGDEEPRLCLPGVLRPTVLHVFHDAAGHWDHTATAKSIATSFAWPGLAADVRDYVESCALCRSRFVSTRGLHAGSGFPLEPAHNFEAWHCDLAGPIRLKGDNVENFYVLGFICRKSRWVEATVINGKEAATTARAFVQELLRRYGSPVMITSDSGGEFMGEFAGTLKELGIKHHMSTPLHHTGNSIIERFWRTMWDRAALTVPEDRIDWKAIVHAAAAFHNMHAPEKSTASPFETVFHQAPRSALDAAWRPLALPFNKDVDERIEAALGIRRRDQQQRVRERAGRAQGGRRPALKKTFEVGDAVWALRTPPAEDAALTTAKLLCRMAPGNVTKVVDGSANRYGVTFCDNGRYVERHVDHLRDRASRALLLREWECMPLNSDRDEPGCDMVNPAADILLPAAPRQLRPPKKGMVVVMAQEYAQVPGLHRWAVPSRPLPIVGTVTDTTPGSDTVTVRWLANAAGDREPNARVELKPSRCLAPFADDSFTHHKFPKNAWAPYTGPSLEAKPRLLTLIYRNGQTTFNGRPITKWRARGVGLGPDNDILFETEDRIKELFPDDDVDAMMRRFVAQAERVSA